MKIPFYLIFFFIFTVSYSHEKADSTRAKLKAYGTISLNSNGIAPIPAFSLDKPAVIAAITLAKNRFSYDPLFAYSLDFRPWIIDNWLRYKIVDKPALEFRIGIDISTFFSEYKVPGEVILQAQRYIITELAAVYKYSPNSSSCLMHAEHPV